MKSSSPVSTSWTLRQVTSRSMHSNRQSAVKNGPAGNWSRVAYISQQTAHLTEFDESLVRRWIRQITIWDDHTTVELKFGVSIDVDA